MNITLIQQTPKPIETISNIASICYDSNPEDPMKLVKHLYKNGHHSCYEHIYFTFKKIIMKKILGLIFGVVATKRNCPQLIWQLKH